MLRRTQHPMTRHTGKTVESAPAKTSTGRSPARFQHRVFTIGDRVLQPRPVAPAPARPRERCSPTRNTGDAIARHQTVSTMIAVASRPRAATGARPPHRDPGLFFFRPQVDHGGQLSPKPTTAAATRGHRRIVRKSLGALPSTGHRHSSDRPRRPGDGHPFRGDQETNDHVWDASAG
jgi:hypothetical protein